MRNVLVRAACTCALLVPVSRPFAQTTPAPGDAASAGVTLPAHTFGFQTAEQQKPKKPSPWLLLPLVSSGPKMGTSFGFLGSYLHYFDPKSQVSMFGVMYQYSTTKSQVAAVFARTSFAEDSQRLEGILGYPKVQNFFSTRSQKIPLPSPPSASSGRAALQRGKLMLGFPLR